jgi:hypothetical protein
MESRPTPDLEKDAPRRRLDPPQDALKGELVEQLVARASKSALPELVDVLVGQGALLNRGAVDDVIS